MAIFIGKHPVQDPKMWGLVNPQKSKQEFLEHNKTLGEYEIKNLVSKKSTFFFVEIWQFWHLLCHTKTDHLATETTLCTKIFKKFDYKNKSFVWCSFWEFDLRWRQKVCDVTKRERYFHFLFLFTFTFDLRFSLLAIFNFVSGKINRNIFVFFTFYFWLSFLIIGDFFKFGFLENWQKQTYGSKVVDFVERIAFCE